MRSLPVSLGAWRDGVLSEGQVKAVLANVANRHVDLFASQEEIVIPALVGHNVAETQAAMMSWRLHAEALDEFDPPAMPSREMHLSETLDGRWEQSGSFDAEGGAVIEAAMRLVMDVYAEDNNARDSRMQHAKATRWSMCVGSLSTTRRSRVRRVGTDPTCRWR